MLHRSLISGLPQTPMRSAILRTTPLKLVRRQGQLVRTHLAQRQTFLSSAPVIRAYNNSLTRWRPSFVQRLRNTRSNNNKAAPPVAQEISSQASQSLSGRLKELSRKYGWAAAGVYLGLSVIDFPFCFMAVRLIGTERIAEAEHAVIHGFWSLVAIVLPNMRPDEKAQSDAAETEARESVAIDGNGHKHKEEPSIWTQLLLAYGVHKSLIFFRIPLTAAVTPKVVKTLRGWGWNVGRPGNFKRAARRVK